jgi:hypothetical protein
LLVWGLLEVAAHMALGVMPSKASDSSSPEWLVHAKDALRSGFFIPDEHAIWVPAPNYTQAFDGAGIYGKDKTKLNAFGHRSPPMSREKPEGVRRVMVLGGSHPFGMWVSSNEAYSAVLSERLNAAGPHRWEVMNAASPGHTTFQGKEYLLHTGWQFSPDVVVFDLGMNDDLPLTVDYAAPDHEVAAVPGWAKATAEQADGSAVYRLLQRLLASSVGARQAGWGAGADREAAGEPADGGGVGGAARRPDPLRQSGQPDRLGRTGPRALRLSARRRWVRADGGRLRAVRGHGRGRRAPVRRPHPRERGGAPRHR